APARHRGTRRPQAGDRLMSAPVPSKAVRIDALRETDAPRCAAPQRPLFPGDHPWSAPASRQGLRARHAPLAARDGALPAGSAALGFVAGRPHAEAEIHTSDVDPAPQRRGIGRALLRGLLAIADEVGATVFLEVRTDNEAAR